MNSVLWGIAEKKIFVKLFKLDSGCLVRRIVFLKNDIVRVSANVRMNQETRCGVAVAFG